MIDSTGRRILTLNVTESTTDDFVCQSAPSAIARNITRIDINAILFVLATFTNKLYKKNPRINWGFLILKLNYFKLN